MTKMKLVPIEPTDEMIGKAVSVKPIKNGIIDVRDIYRAMTAVCPTIEAVKRRDIEGEILKYIALKTPLYGAVSTTHAVEQALHYLTINGYKIIKEAK